MLLERQLGVETVVASLDDTETVRKAAAKADGEVLFYIAYSITYIEG